MRGASGVTSVIDILEDDADMEQANKRRSDSVVSLASVEGHSSGAYRRTDGGASVPDARTKRRLRRNKAQEEYVARQNELRAMRGEDLDVGPEPDEFGTMEDDIGESDRPWYGYGNWVGPGWSDGRAQDSVANATVGVVDDYDATGRTHDLAYGRGEDRAAADVRFFRDNVGRGVAGDAYHTVHRNVAAVGVGGQGLARYVYGNRYNDEPSDSLARFGEWFRPQVGESDGESQVVVTFGDRINREAKRRLEIAQSLRNQKSQRVSEGQSSNRNKPEEVLPSRRPITDVEIAPTGHLRGGKIPKHDWYDEL